MRPLIWLFALFFYTAHYSQQLTKINYVGYAGNTYFEIAQNRNGITVLKYFFENKRIKKDSVMFTSLEELKDKYDFELFLKSKRLQKESSFLAEAFPTLRNNTINFGKKASAKLVSKPRRVRRLGFQTTTDSLYSFHFYENGAKSLWYLSGNSGVEIENRFWCEPKKQPAFIPVRNETFDVFLVNRNGKLSVLYFDKRRGLQGYIFF